MVISLDGGDVVLVAWSWQWWHEGCGLWVLWHGFLLGCKVVRWLWRGGGVVTGHGSIWVVGCGLGIDVDGAWCVAGERKRTSEKERKKEREERDL